MTLQDNYKDCGVFIISYFQHFIESPPSWPYSNNSIQKWVDEYNDKVKPKELRRNYREILFDLYKQDHPGDEIPDSIYGNEENDELEVYISEDEDKDENKKKESKNEEKEEEIEIVENNSKNNKKSDENNSYFIPIPLSSQEEEEEEREKEQNHSSSKSNCEESIVISDKDDEDGEIDEIESVEDNSIKIDAYSSIKRRGIPSFYKCSLDPQSPVKTNKFYG